MLSLDGCRDIEVPAEAPEEIAQLIDDCLQPNPSKRPTAQDLVARLQVHSLNSHGESKTSFAESLTVHAVSS